MWIFFKVITFDTDMFKQVEYVSLDGAAVNRKLIKLNAKHNIKGKKFTSRNLSDRKKSITWIMDPKVCRKC